MTLRLLSALALLLALAAPTTAVAQGRCRCNMGCHQYPGQCVSNGNAGCDPGYAPFCGTRAATCPSTGWVTCNGECTCTRVGPGDAGVAPLDASTPADVPAPLDVGPRMDVPASDRPVSGDVVVVDRPRADSASAADTPASGLDAPMVLSDAPAVLSDAPAGSDAASPPQDAPVTQADAPLVSLPDSATTGDAAVCACDGGPCYLGTCPTTRCRFEMELGFICPLPGHTCRVLADEAWCVPACLDVQCPAGATCDPRTGTCGALDCDAQRTCPAGARCVMNRCAPVGTGDGGLGDGGAVPDTANGGCGCRAAHRGDTPRGALALLAICALAGRRRASRGRRSLTAEPPPRARS